MKGIRVTLPTDCTPLVIPASEGWPLGKNCRCCENYPEKQKDCHCHKPHPAVDLGREAGRNMARAIDQQIIDELMEKGIQ